MLYKRSFFLINPGFCVINPQLIRVRHLYLLLSSYFQIYLAKRSNTVTVLGLLATRFSFNFIRLVLVYDLLFFLLGCLGRFFLTTL